MGLNAWKGAVVRKADVVIAKNYLRADEIAGLNRIVVMFLDYAEDQAQRHKQVFLADWRKKLDDFLRFNERGVLPDTGKVSREVADERANEQYERFSARRRGEVESQAELDGIRELEQTMKERSPTPRPPRPRGKTS